MADKEKEPTPLDRLLGIASRSHRYHTPEGEAFADVTVGGQRESWPVRSEGFRLWLLKEFFEGAKTGCAQEPLAAAINTIEALANAGEERNVFNRVARTADAIYVDLCDRQRCVAEITARSIRVLGSPEVRFRRSRGSGSLPAPVQHGSIDDLRRFLNVEDDEFVLLVSWLLFALQGVGPFPVLVLSGPEGSAKTTTAKVLASLVDPIKSGQAPPHREDDLLIAAKSRYVLVYDNVSQIKPWMADAFCRLSTGGSLCKRKLYSDADAHTIEVMRPLILNGIGTFVDRPDLASRCLFIELLPIADSERRTEKELLRDFEAARPAIFSGLIKGLQTGLEMLPKIHPPKLSRMADFECWGIACETSFWPAGTFERVHSGNIGRATLDQVEASPIASSVIEFMASRQEWSGTAQQLLDQIEGAANPAELSNELSRATAILAKNGISVTRSRTGARRMIRIVRLAGGDGGDAGLGAPVTSKPLKTGRMTLSDGSDGTLSIVGEKQKNRDVEEKKDATSPVIVVTPVTGVAFRGNVPALIRVLPPMAEHALTRDQIAIDATILPLRLGQAQIRSALRHLVEVGIAYRTCHAVPRYWRAF